MTPAPTREDTLDAMERDVAEAMRRHMPAYFRAGAPSADRMMGEMAGSLYRALWSLGLTHIRDEHGAPLHPLALHMMAAPAFEVAATDALTGERRTAAETEPAA